MQIATNITSDDFREIHLDIYKSRMKKPVIILAILLVINLLTWISGVVAFDVIKPQLIVFPLIIVLVFLVLRNSATTIYKTTPRLHGFTTWIFNGNILSVSNASVSTTLDLGRAYKIEEMKKSFLFYESAMTCHYLAKKYMSGEDIRTLRNLLRMQNGVQKLTLRED